MSYTAPIGFTQGRWSIAAGAGTINADRQLVFFSNENVDKVKCNGTAFFVLGADLEKYGDLSFGFTFISGVGDNVSSLQPSPKTEDKFQFSVGCQDLGGSGGSSGTNVAGDDRTNRSFYGAATYQVSEGVFLSGGLGTGCFQKGFGSTRTNVGRQFKLLARTTSWCGKTLRTAEITISLGIVQNRYDSWSLVASF
jgi:hypothetical protein